MDFQLITQYPGWFILICLLAGFIYSWVLYRRDESPRILKWMMAIFRFFCVSILATLLLSPMIRSIFKEIEKPIIIVVQDNSESVLSGTDTSKFKQDYGKSMEELQHQLEGDFDVRTFSAGDAIKEGMNFTFSDKQTDLSQAVPELKARFSGRNIGAIILASDGLINKGNNPQYTFPELKVPVFTIAMGDTTVRKDLLISRINHNKTAFFGNTFPVEITIDARQCQGTNAKLEITRDKEVLISKQISINSNRFSTPVTLFMEAKQKGINHFKATVSGASGEVNYKNNVRDFFVEVSDIRQKILVIANAPNPDLALIRSTLESNPNYEVKVTNINDFNGDVGVSNLVILHELPSLTNSAAPLFDKLKKSGIPMFIILGSQTNVTAFNNLSTGVRISDNRGNQNEVQAAPNPDFSLFTTEEENLRRIANFPPLIVPFGNYEINGNVYSLLTQKVGAVKTVMPLLFFSENEIQKTGVLAGEGIWKWGLREFSENQNRNAVSELIIKTVQYLASREKKTPFRLFYKNAYPENEPLTIDAELYNESGEMVNTPEARLTLTDENGKSFPFVFSRTEKAYSLNAGYLPVGSYKFTASTVLGGKNYSESGTVIITPLQAELAETIANHQLLNSISENTGGKMVGVSNMNQLADLIKKREDIKPVSYVQKKLKDVINLKWIFILIMSLLAAEWFFRKRSGGY